MKTVPFGNRNAFTLIELLVALAVLAMILVLFSQIVVHVSSLTRASTERLDAGAAARAALDRIASDIQSRVQREDTEVLIEKRAGNDEIFLFTESPAPSAASSLTDTVALVGYGVGLDGSRSNGLQRFARGVGLQDPAFFLPRRLTRPSGIRAEDLIELPGEVIRFEVEFLMADGSVRDSVPTRQQAGKGDYFFVRADGTRGMLSGSEIPCLDEVSAMILSIAVVESGTRDRLSDAQWNSLMAAIASALPDAVNGSGNATTGTRTWENRALDGFESLPAGVANRIRIYQRLVPLHE